jgi:hypothetical protein
MNIKALITTLLLGTSSVAMARPVSMPGGVLGSSGNGNGGIVPSDRAGNGNGGIVPSGRAGNGNGGIVPSDRAGSGNGGIVPSGAVSPNGNGGFVPGGVVPRHHADAPVVRDHRTQHAAPAPGPLHSPPFIPAWVTLGTVDRILETSIAFRADQRQTGVANGFTTIRLQSTAGKSLISRVEITFANGATQVVQLGQYLTAASPVITIDLAGERRAVRTVNVVGRNARQSAFSVQAM